VPQEAPVPSRGGGTRLQATAQPCVASATAQPCRSHRYTVIFFLSRPHPPPPACSFPGVCSSGYCYPSHSSFPMLRALTHRQSGKAEHRLRFLRCFAAPSEALTRLLENLECGRRGRAHRCRHRHQSGRWHMWAHEGMATVEGSPSSSLPPPAESVDFNGLNDVEPDETNPHGFSKYGLPWAGLRAGQPMYRVTSIQTCGRRAWHSRIACISRSTGAETERRVRTPKAIRLPPVSSRVANTSSTALLVRNNNLAHVL
jgi:hypothetical protein